MNCNIDNYKTDNRKSFSNHMRWHKGLMSKNSFIGMNLGNRNGMWKGDKVGKINLHKWIKRRINMPLYCSMCKKRKELDLANISQLYKRDILDWEWLCRSCHMKKDGRLNKLQESFKIWRDCAVS